MLLRTSFTDRAKVLKTAYTQHRHALVGQVNGFFVFAYKILGFFLLGAILAGMLGYLSHSIFYLANRSWIQPIDLAPTHEKVVAAQQMYVEQTLLLDKLTAEDSALGEEIEATRASLRALEPVTTEINKLENTILPDSLSKSELQHQLAMHEITREEYGRLIGFLDSQKLHRWNAKRESIELFFKTQSLRQKIEQAIKRRAFLATALKDETELVKRISEDPYYVATKNGLHAAFVPYDNRGAVPKDGKNEVVAVFGCHLGFIFCKKVGESGQLFSGERRATHPVSGKEVRGQWLGISLNDPSWASSTELFLGRPPLFL